LNLLIIDNQFNFILFSLATYNIGTIYIRLYCIRSLIVNKWTIRNYTRIHVDWCNRLFAWLICHLLFSAASGSSFSHCWTYLSCDGIYNRYFTYYRYCCSRFGKGWLKIALITLSSLHHGWLICLSIYLIYF